jgi:hypothetical protein
MAVENKAAIMAVLGASGSGKSTFVKREISRCHPRLLIWDPLSEYEGATTGRVDEVLAALRSKKFRVVFRPSSDDKVRALQFDLICRAALAAGNLTLVVEELRFVTTPSRAPVGWARVCLTGRHKGLTVYGLSQRPASIDKDFLGNCTRIRTGRLAYPEDVNAVRKAMGIRSERVKGAPLTLSIDDLQPLEWIEKDNTTGKFSAGKLKF